MKLSVVALLEVIHLYVEQFIGLLARAVSKLAFGHVAVDHSYDGHALLLVLVSSTPKVLHLVYMYERIDISSKFVNAALHKGLYPAVSQVAH